MKTWYRQRRAVGIVIRMKRSDDPRAMLMLHRRYIDDLLVGQIIANAYEAQDADDHHKALTWASLAQEASLLGGTRALHASALVCHAIALTEKAKTLPRKRDPAEAFLQDTGLIPRYQAAEKIGPEQRSLLTHALELAQQARDIFQDMNHYSGVYQTHEVTASIHQAGGDLISALETQIAATTMWTARDSLPDTMGRSLENVAKGYWQLDPGSEPAGAACLLAGGAELLKVAAQWPIDKSLADLLDVLGRASRIAGNAADAFDYWSKAATIYRSLGGHPNTFLVLGRMQDLAYDCGDLDRSIGYGEACLQAAPMESDPAAIASRQHLLAWTYDLSDHCDDAARLYRSAYHEYQRTNAKGCGATDCTLQRALMEARRGEFEEARLAFEAVCDSPFTLFHTWIVDMELAEIYWRSNGDLGTAIRRAEKALQNAVALRMSMTCRAASLRLSGVLFLASGDAEKALKRFSQVLRILSAGPLEGSELKLNRLFDYHVASPNVAEIAFFASLAAKAAGQDEAAGSHFDQYLRIAAEGPVQENEEDSDDAFAEGARLLVHGSRLMFADPGAAIEKLDDSVKFLGESGDPQLMTIAQLSVGQCQLILRDYAEAKEAFLQVGKLLPVQRDDEISLGYRRGLCLAELAMGNQRHAQAHLVEYVRIAEKYRASLPSIEERLRFTALHLPYYSMLVRLCVSLGAPVLALETVELIKSRTLTDLLAQDHRKPIDYGLAALIEDNREVRESWIEEFSTKSYPKEDDDEYWHDDPLKSASYRVLATSVDNDEEMKKIAREVRDRQIFERLESSQMDFSHEAIRTFLTP